MKLCEICNWHFDESAELWDGPCPDCGSPLQQKVTSVAELIQLLKQLPADKPVFSECPETGYSWSLRGVADTPKGVVILIDEHTGIRAPDDDERQ